METIATTKGQVVIPSAVRRKLGIKEGTRIKLEVDEREHYVILKPVTRESMRKFRGMLKVKPGEKSATQQLLEERAEDRRREEAKFAKHGVR